ncbi:efflux RND transporter permease subunit [Geofilum sp. OHC36d9]|uniref:efflux RND transporter permease subunit n=1 Tax=Geofilum sp. OHC36d9 TaxID=3458413 RepID=UPI004034A107
MSYQYAPLLPEDDSTNLNYQNFKDLFGEESSIIVLGVQEKDLFIYNHYLEWEKMTQELKTISGVEEVFSVFNVLDLVKNTRERKFQLTPVFKNINTQAQLDSAKQKLEHLPFYDNLIYNRATDTYLVAITIDPKILGSSDRVQLVDNIKIAVDKYKIASQNEVKISGLPYIRVETAEMIKKELSMFIYLTLAITALIIFLFFRSFKVVLFSMLVVGVAVIWALGSQAVLGFKITILTGMIPPLIIVIGIPNSVFLLNKYHQEFSKHGNKIKSLQRVIRKIGNATFLTNLTTASGFATFIFTSSKIMVEFGIIAAINIIVVFLLSLLLIPIIFSFLPDPKERHIQHLENKYMTSLVANLVQISLNHRSKVFAFTLVMVLAGGYGISRMKTTGYMLDDIPHRHALYKDLKFFEQHFNGLMPLEIVIDTRKPGMATQVVTMKKMDKLQQKLNKIPELSRPVSYIDAVKFARQAYYNGNPAYYSLPGSRERAFLLSYLAGQENSTKGLVNNFIDSTRQKARISLRMEDIGTTRMASLDSLINSEINDVFPSDKYDTMVSGSSIVFAQGTNYLIRNLFTSLLLAIILIASFMAWMFTSKRMVLISLIPNLIPLIMTAALMGYFGIPIKPSTILVFSIAFGISVDDTIHFLAKYRQELSETNWNIRTAVILALKETGISMIYTSIILFFGFGVFSLSNFGGTVALGLLVAFTLLIAMFSNLILLPSILLAFERLITNQHFKEPLLQIYNEDEDIEIDELVINPTNRKNSIIAKDDQ